MYDEAVERLRKYANEFQVGDPNKEGDHIGPVISETQFNKIQGLIQKGIDEGAKLVSGGPGKHCRYFKMKVLNSHESNEITNLGEENFDERSIVFSDKSTSYVDISKYVDVHVSEIPAML